MRYLIDLRPIDGTLRTLERLELGEYMGETLRHVWIAAISKRARQKIRRGFRDARRYICSRRKPGRGIPEAVFHSQENL